MNINKILSEMTLEEKARLVNGATFFGMAEIERFGIQRIQLLDGGTGINFEQLFGDMVDVGKLAVDSTNGMVGSIALIHVIEYYFEPEKLTPEELGLHEWIKERLEKNLNGADYAPACLPPGILLGATWNKEVVREVGEALGREADLYGIDILLGTPNVNIHRDPLNGRLFEGYSEDPCLVSELAPELVKGVQKYGVAANVKHFAANNQETNRVGINEVISSRALEEIYFPGFKACVQEGDVKTVMSAYTGINGVPCTENYWLLTEKLRDEWGFDGVVLSDWGAVYHPVEALQAGNDLAMPGPIAWEPIAEAVKDGRLQESELNLAAERLLKLIDWIVGNHADKTDTETLKKMTDKAAYRAAAEGVVLVENAGILPFLEGTNVKLAGSGADELLQCGSGSAGITTNRTSKIQDMLCMAEEGQEDVIVFVCKLSGMEGNDRPNMYLAEDDLRLLEKYGAVKNDCDIDKKEYKPIVLVLNVCGPVDLSSLDRKVVKAVLIPFLPGMEGGRAVADILTGKINPSGKLPITFPMRYEDTPTYLNFPGDGYEVCYGEGIYVGYRYYDKKKIRPLYPFGFGLSYTSFECCGLEDIQLAEGNITFSVTVRNTGKYAGAQTVQVYAKDPFSTLHKPVKELVAFEKIYLEAGEQKCVKFEISASKLSSYDADLKQWTLEEGYYDIVAATSSDEKDIFAEKRIYLDCKSPYSYGLSSTVKTIYEHEELKSALKALWDDKNWDWGIVESNYQYTSNKTIEQILPIETDSVKSKIDGDNAINKFIQMVSFVKKN